MGFVLGSPQDFFFPYAYAAGDLSGIDIEKLDSKTIYELLLFGSPNINVIVSRIILEGTISFIKSTQ